MRSGNAGKGPLRRSVPIVALVSLALASMLWAGRCGARSGVTPAAQRGRPRELAFTTVDGTEWRLSRERGHVVAVNFWATWCGPCRSETPLLVAVSADLAPAGFRTLGVSLDHGSDRLERVRAFAATFRVAYPLAFPSDMSQIESGLDGVPTTLLFDRQGRAAKVYFGEVRERTLRQDAAELLHEP